jgi:protein-tyrosine phosphatase
MSQIGKKRILLVCMGNICRSPTAEGVMRALVRQMGLDSVVEIDSAGTHGYHIGDAPDPRTVMAAAKRGYDLATLRARQVTALDFASFDYIFAMDRSNLDLLHQACPAQYRYKLGLFLQFAPNFDDDEVPDPYYGGIEGFERVLDLVEDAAQGVIDILLRK